MTTKRVPSPQRPIHGSQGQQVNWSPHKPKVASLPDGPLVEHMDPVRVLPVGGARPSFSHEAFRAAGLSGGYAGEQNPGTSGLPLAVFSAAVFGLVLYNIFRLATKGVKLPGESEAGTHDENSEANEATEDQADGGRHRSGASAGRLRDLSTINRGKRSRTSREEQTNRLISCHGSRAIRFLIAELLKQRQKLMSADWSQLEPIFLPNDRVDGADAELASTAHSCDCPCHFSGSGDTGGASKMTTDNLQSPPLAEEPLASSPKSEAEKQETPIGSLSSSSSSLFQDRSRGERRKVGPDLKAGQ